jgi:hypothetical protein
MCICAGQPKFDNVILNSLQGSVAFGGFPLTTAKDKSGSE